MTLNPLGIEVPADTDEFVPAADMRELAASMAGRVVVPVANVTERDALAATLTPSPSRPLYVHRADAPVYTRLEWTEDGSTWNQITTAKSGWIDWVYDSQWWEYPGFGYRPQYRRDGNRIECRGTLQRKGGNLAAGMGVCNLHDINWAPNAQVSGVQAGGQAANVRVRMESNGIFTIHAAPTGNSTAWFSFDNFGWWLD